jgi:DNA polymerase-3 subunit alpha
MEKFAGYGFNKSHSAAYAMVTYQTAYLKAHYAPEFMAAQLTCESGNSDKVTLYISECRDRAIEILPPHINLSFQDFHVGDGKIVFGLGAVKNVGEGAVASIVQARQEGGPFCSPQDFARRVDLRKVNKKVIESLIKCGALDSMGYTRRSMVDNLDHVLERAASYQKEKANGQGNLFQSECLPGTDSREDPPIPELAEWDDLKKLSFEREMIGFYITGHPLMKYDALIKKYANVSSSGLSSLPQSSQVRLAGLVKTIKEINTRKGGRMAFVTLEDLEGDVEVTVFADLYAQTRDLLSSGEPLIVSGVRERDQESSKILAQEICHIEQAPNRFSHGIHVRISTPGVDPAQVADLKRIFKRHAGKLPVTLHVVVPNRTETVITLPSVLCGATDALVGEVNATFGYQAVTFE